MALYPKDNLVGFPQLLEYVGTKICNCEDIFV